MDYFLLLISLQEVLLLSMLERWFVTRKQISDLKLATWSIFWKCENNTRKWRNPFEPKKCDNSYMYRCNTLWKWGSFYQSFLWTELWDSSCRWVNEVLSIGSKRVSYSTYLHYCKALNQERRRNHHSLWWKLCTNETCSVPLWMPFVLWFCPVFCLVFVFLICFLFSKIFVWIN